MSKSLTLDEFFERLRKLPTDEYIVMMDIRYDWEKDGPPKISNQLLEYDGNENQYVWLNDWDEGQQIVRVLGCIAVSDVCVPYFPNVSYDEAMESLRRITDGYLHGPVD